MPNAERITAEILAGLPPFDDALALRTYQHLSHTPEDRARQERDAFEAHILDTVRMALVKAETDEQLAELQRAVSVYAISYRSRLYDVLTARSKTASAFITGGANFPTRRNQKALGVETRREDALRKYVKLGRSRVVDRIAALETPAQKSAAIVRRMCAEIDKDLATIATIERGDSPGFDVKAFVSSITRIVRGLHRKGFQAEANAVLDHIAARREELGIAALAKSSIWKLRTDLETEPS